MTKLLIALSLLISTNLLAADCEGRFDIHVPDNPVHKKIPLELKVNSPAFEMYEGQIDDIHYSVTISKNGEYAMGVYFGPDYTEGTRMSGAMTGSSQLRLAYVKGVKAFNIICQ